MDKFVEQAFLTHYWCRRTDSDLHSAAKIVCEKMRLPCAQVYAEHYGGNVVSVDRFNPFKTRALRKKFDEDVRIE